MLQLLGINQYYGGSHILRNVGFEAHVGEVTVVLGRNGVGKTTLLKSLMGVVPVKTGSIRLDGADITHMPMYKRARLGIAGQRHGGFGIRIQATDHIAGSPMHVRILQGGNRSPATFNFGAIHNYELSVGGIVDFDLGKVKAKF